MLPRPLTVAALLLVGALAGCLAPSTGPPAAGTGALVRVQYVGWDVVTGEIVESSFDGYPRSSLPPALDAYRRVFASTHRRALDAADRVLNALDRLEDDEMPPTAATTIARDEIGRVGNVTRALEAADPPPGLGPQHEELLSATRRLRSGLVAAEACAADDRPDCPDGRGLTRDAKAMLRDAAQALPPEAFRRPVALAESPRGVGEAWVYLWDEDAATARRGTGIVVDVALRDLDGDGTPESLLRTRADVEGDEGRRLVRNERRFVDRLPADAVPTELTSPGLAAALRGRTADTTLSNLAVPEAYRPSRPETVRELPRTITALPRDLTDLPRDRVERRSDLDGSTREGDVVSYRRGSGESPVPAEVTNLTAERVSLHLLVEEGMRITRTDRWNVTVAAVANGSYAVRRHPEPGAVYTARDQRIRVLSVNATHFAADLGSRVAGHPVAYDLRVLEVRPDPLLHVGRSRTPFRYQNHIHEIEAVGAAPMMATHYDLLVTFDNGTTWLPFSDRLRDEDVTAVEVSPGARTHYVSTVDEPLLRSTDGGRSWRTDEEGLPDRFLDAISVSPADPDVVYAIPEDGDLHRSGDRGATWVARDAPPATEAVVADPADPDTVWAAAADGLYRSTDGGGQWDRIAWEGRDVRDVVPLPDGRVFAVVDGCLARSPDGGASWRVVHGRRVAALDMIEPTGDPGTLLGAANWGKLVWITEGGERFVDVPTGAPPVRRLCAP